MAKPIIHARSSARRFGGVAEDYLGIHDLMDSSKSAFPDNRHRALTHNNWFFFIVERIYGHEINLTCAQCGDNEALPVRRGECSGCGAVRAFTASTRDVCEQHVLEDFGNKFIPTVSDYFEGMDFQPWMNNATGGPPPSSHRKLQRQSRTTRRRAITLD